MMSVCTLSISCSCLAVDGNQTSLPYSTMGRTYVRNSMRLTSTLMLRLFQIGMSAPFTRCTLASIFSKCVVHVQQTHAMQTQQQTHAMQPILPQDLTVEVPSPSLSMMQVNSAMMVSGAESSTVRASIRFAQCAFHSPLQCQQGCPSHLVQQALLCSPSTFHARLHCSALKSSGCLKPIGAASCKLPTH
ncbi:hypothetical protein COO60DRAFT_307444 [Scenedesmus sp. NREL 46B-D3]|nr:hypothetical protein COO60DRAFT_307444 [Scenedesmus sp. NREL 46B-D3]